MKILGVLILAAAGTVGGNLPWYNHYDQALSLIEEGKPVEARQHLEAAIAKRAEPGRSVRVYGNRYMHYLPYLYLTVAAQMSGEVALAKSSLLKAEDAGVAETTDVGQTLLPAYRVLLEKVKAADAGDASEAEDGESFLDVPSEDVVLSDDEYEVLKKEIERRCGLSGASEPSRRPWYFHYELGLVLSDRDDPQRALGALIAAADRRPASQRGARMYGMWFTDYLPYYQIAKAHSALNNWECALDALEVSRKMGEIEENDDEYAEFRRLLEEARDQRDASATQE